MHFVCAHVVHPYSSMETATAWKKFNFVLLDRSDSHMIDGLSVAVHALARRILTSFSEGEIMLARYVNLSTNFRGSPNRMEMDHFYLNIYFV